MSSNCNRFRFLIQQKFDTELSNSDERTVAGHMQSCESCGKFQHQLQQVIMAAEEVPLPEEMLPPNPEALARTIMSQLPEQKQSIFAKLFGGLFGGKKSASKDRGAATTPFPHVSRKTGKQPDQEQTESGGGSGGFFGKKDDDHTGTANRLRTIATKHSDDNRDAQSQTKSLSEKMGFAPPSNNLADEQPLTLAESIRRKISESQKIGVDEPAGKEMEPSMASAPPTSQERQSETDWPPKSKAPANMAAPPQVPGMQSPGMQSPGMVAPPPEQPTSADAPPVLGSWGKPTPVESSNWGAAPGAPGMDPFGGAQPPGAAPMQAPAPVPAPAPAAQAGGTAWGGSGTWDDPPRGAKPADQNSDWGPPPQGGAWEEPAQGAWSAAPAGPANGMGNSGGMTSMPAPPTPPAAPAPMSNWGSPPAQAPTPAPIPAPVLPPAPGQQTGGDPWSGNDSWGASGQKSWGQSGAPGAWGQGQAAQPPQAPQPVQPPQPPQIPQAPQIPLAPQIPQATLDNSGPSTTWATPGSSQTTEGWSKPPTEGSPTTSSWGQPGAVDGWGAKDSPPKPTTSMWGQPGAPASPTNVQPQQSSSTMSNWGQPGGTEAGAGGQAWGQPADANNAAGAAWGQPSAPTGDNGWGQADKPGDKPPAKAWSLEAEQIETGTWQAFSPGVDGGLGAKPNPSRAWGASSAQMPPTPPAQASNQSFAPAAPAAAAGAGDANRWDVPIQERMKMQAQAQAQAQPAAAMQPGAMAQPQQAQQAQQAQPQQAQRAPGGYGVDDKSMQTKSGWNFPIFEAAETVSQPEAKTTDPSLWDLPAAPQAVPGAAVQSAGMPGWGNSTTSSTDWGQPAMAQPPQMQPAVASQPMTPPAQQASASSRWDVPIQERQAQPEPTPAPTAAWGALQQPAPQQPAPQPVPVAAQIPPPPAQAAAAQPAGLFQNFDDTAIDKLFSENLGVSDASGRNVNAGMQAAPAPQAAAAGWAEGAPAQPAAAAWGELPPAQPSATGWAAPPQAPPAPGWGEPPQVPAQPSIANWGEPPQVPAQPSVAAWGEPSQTSAPAPAAGPEPVLGQAPGYSWGETAAPAAAPTITPAVSAGQFAPAPAAYPPPQQQQSYNQAQEAPIISAVSSRNSQSAMTQPLPDRRSPFSSSQPPQPAAADATGQQGLFNLDDSAMDKLFSENLGVPEAAMAAQKAAPAQASAQPAGNPFNNIQAPPAVPAPQPSSPFSSQPAMQAGMASPPMPATGAWASTSQTQPAAAQPAPSQPQAAGAAQGGGLFSIDDSVIDRIFSENLGVPKEQGGLPQINVNEVINKISEVATAGPLPPPKIEGVGRLDPKIETVESGSGRIASIGKFLLDQKDLEKIGKITGSDFTDTKMRILTMEAAGELQALLQHIGSQDKVVGSVIVGHDGLLIANTMPSDLDAESIGVWALGVYMNTEHVIKKMGQDRVHQIVSRTPKGYLVIADFGGGLLVTVSDGKDTDTLIPLMRSITQLVQQ